MLGTLSGEQRVLVLGYAHHLGAYYGKPLEATCKSLDEENQQRVAQYINYVKNPAAVGRTTVHWDQDTLLFKPIEEGTILIDSFVVTNTGTAPYVINDVKSSCDCVVLSYPKFPVMPGDSDVVRIEFDSVNKAGHALPGIILYDNSTPNRRNILRLSGNIAPRDKVKVIIRN